MRLVRFRKQGSVFDYATICDTYIARIIQTTFFLLFWAGYNFKVVKRNKTKKNAVFNRFLRSEYLGNQIRFLL